MGAHGEVTFINALNSTIKVNKNGQIKQTPGTVTRIGTQGDIRVLNDGITTKINDHESRIRLLETFKSVLMGGFILSNIIIVPIMI